MTTANNIRNTSWTQLYLWFDGDQHGYTRIIAESEEEALAFNGGKPLPTFRGKYLRQQETPTHYITTIWGTSGIVAETDQDAISYAKSKYKDALVIVSREFDMEQIYC